jgi:hypothetical protein
MAAIREQMNQSWQQNNPYPNYTTPPQYQVPVHYPPPPPPMPAVPPPGYYNPAEINRYSKPKEKPENPFG